MTPLNMSLEERVAHLQYVVDDLSDVVARQGQELVLLNQRVELLLRREAEREAHEGSGMVFGDERPPHY